MAMASIATLVITRGYGIDAIGPFVEILGEFWLVGFVVERWFFASKVMAGDGGFKHGFV